MTAQAAIPLAEDSVLIEGESILVAPDPRLAVPVPVLMVQELIDPDRAARFQ